MIREVWMPVLDYEGVYEASNLGRIQRVSSGRYLKASFSAGYKHVSLSMYGVITTHRVHKLVLTAFCGPAPFENMEACHNDGVPANCELTNLRWGYNLENREDMKTHGTKCFGERIHNAVLKEADVLAIRKRTATGELNPSIADDYGVSISTIHLIRHGRIWKHLLPKPGEPVNG